MLMKSTTSLYTRFFIVNSPLRYLRIYDLTVFMSCGKTIPGIHRLTQLVLSPVDCVFTKYIPHHNMRNDGVVANLSIVIILLNLSLTNI